MKYETSGSGTNQVITGNGNSNVQTGAGDDKITVGNGNNYVDGGAGMILAYMGRATTRF